jgi:hypothetical protein
MLEEMAVLYAGLARFDEARAAMERSLAATQELGRRVDAGSFDHLAQIEIAAGLLSGALAGCPRVVLARRGSSGPPSRADEARLALEEAVRLLECKEDIVLSGRARTALELDRESVGEPGGSPTTTT